MSAIIIGSYGPPPLLQQAKIAAPQPGPDQLLVEVMAGGVNPLYSLC
jgi:NADPH:quinone reductase-like Zn-dependent oxidoreductase